MFAVLFLLSAGAAGAACTDADKAALEKFDRDWSVAGSSGDRATLEKIYAKNYADLTPGGARSRADVIDGMVKNPEAAKASGKSDPVTTQDFYEINCTDRSALITHRVWGTDGDGADAKVWQARSIHQLEKIDGRWQAVSNTVHNLSDEWIVGYNNSYNAPDSINQIDWRWKSENKNVVDYYKNLIQLRKNHPAFYMSKKEDVLKNLVFQKVEDGLISFQISNHANGDEWKNILVIYNARPEIVKYKLKEDWKLTVWGDQFNMNTDPQEEK